MKSPLAIIPILLWVFAISSCQQAAQETACDISWDTISFHQEGSEQQIARIDYKIDIVIPKSDVNEALTSIRQQLLAQLFSYPLSSDDETDFVALDLSNALECLDHYVEYNQRDWLNAAAYHEATRPGNDETKRSRILRTEQTPWSTWTCYMPWSDAIELRPFLVDDAFVTFILNKSSFTGGAHGDYSTTYLTFDTQTGDPIYDTDLFQGGTEGELSHLLRASLVNYCENYADLAHDTDDILDTADFWIENLLPNSNFFLTPDSIYYTFNVHEIAPYCCGCHTFGFSAQEAKPYLNRQSIAYKYWKFD